MSIVQQLYADCIHNELTVDKAQFVFLPITILDYECASISGGIRSIKSILNVHNRRIQDRVSPRPLRQPAMLTDSE